MGLSSLGRNLQHYHLGTARVTEEMETLELKLYHKVTPYTHRHVFAERAQLQSWVLNPGAWCLGWDAILRLTSCLSSACWLQREEGEVLAECIRVVQRMRKPGFSSQLLLAISQWEVPKRKHWYFFKRSAPTPGDDNGKCLRWSCHIHSAFAALPAWRIHFMRFL